MGCGCCLLGAVGAFVPRLVLLFVWIFTSLVDRAFDTWIAPLVGLLVLPYTTLAYVLLYQPDVGVTGFGWVLVVAALFVDIAHWSGGWYGRVRRLPE